MKRLILVLMLALAAVHAAAMSATTHSARRDGAHEKLLERTEQGEADRYRAAYLLAGLELQAPDPDYGRAIGWLETAARGGHLPAQWLLAKRKLLGGMLGPFEVERDPQAACTLLERIAAAAPFQVRPEAPAGAMIDYGVSLEAARTIRLAGRRLAAKHCPAGMA